MDKRINTCVLDMTNKKLKKKEKFKNRKLAKIEAAVRKPAEDAMLRRKP